MEVKQTIDESEGLSYTKAAKLIIDAYNKVRSGKYTKFGFLGLIEYWLDFAEVTNEEDIEIEQIITEIHSISYEEDIEIYERVKQIGKLIHPLKKPIR